MKFHRGDNKSGSHLLPNVSEIQLPEDFHWPDGARIAVLITFDFQAELGTPVLPTGKPDYMELTERQYGGRRGVWRILEILERNGVKASFMISGRTAEFYPQATRAIHEAGHDIGGHAYLHESLWEMNREQENEVIRKTKQVLEDISGAPLVGWRSPQIRASENTLNLLLENGFIWRSDYLNDDLPYLLKVNGKTMVEIPYTVATDDAQLYMPGSVRRQGGGATVAPGPYGNPRNALWVWQDEFDILYEEAKREPKMFIVTMHPYISGRANRSKAVEGMLKHIKGYPEVWFSRTIDVAELLRKQYVKS